jgi:hypothetical protein
VRSPFLRFVCDAQSFVRVWEDFARGGQNLDRRGKRFGHGSKTFGMTTKGLFSPEKTTDATAKALSTAPKTMDQLPETLKTERSPFLPGASGSGIPGKTVLGPKRSVRSDAECPPDLSFVLAEARGTG